MSDFYSGILWGYFTLHISAIPEKFRWAVPEIQLRRFLPVFAAFFNFRWLSLYMYSTHEPYVRLKSTPGLNTICCRCNCICYIHLVITQAARNANFLTVPSLQNCNSTTTEATVMFHSSKRSSWIALSFLYWLLRDSPKSWTFYYANSKI